jgi:hypothetical protein
MNDRIIEMAIEAGFNPVNCTGSNVPLFEKFAELIVRECMACSTWVGKVNNYAIEPVHTAHTINQRMKEHFGVEE